MKIKALAISAVALLLIFGIYTLFYGLGILVLIWAWNTLAAMAGLPLINFMQGLAVAILSGALGSILSGVKNGKFVSSK